MCVGGGECFKGEVLAVLARWTLKGRLRVITQTYIATDTQTHRHTDTHTHTHTHTHNSLSLTVREAKLIYTLFNSHLGRNFKVQTYNLTFINIIKRNGYVLCNHSTN